MLLKCEIAISNKFCPDARKCHATISVCKKKSDMKSDVVFFIIHTAKNKIGTKYMIKDNLLQVHQRFVEDGKCTLNMKEPPHALIISKADVPNLKKFLRILKLAYKGEDTSTVACLNSTGQLKHCQLEKPKTHMKIESRAKYPIRNSFPVSLESLVINDCNLLKFDARISRLCNLVRLDLSHNKLKGLSDAMDGLSNLRSLTLASNLFEDVPMVLMHGQMSMQLQLLDLSENMIKFLPYQFTNFQQLTTLKLSGNQLEYLPSKIGMLQNLKILALDRNKVKILPWSFSLLQLDSIDLSSNCFDDGSELVLRQPVLDDIPSLFELTASFLIKKRVNVPMDELPHFIVQQLKNVKFCPCGTPCFSHCVPYMRAFNLHEISSSVTFDRTSTVNLIGYLCSKFCYQKWIDNPNTLFTHKKNR